MRAWHRQGRAVPVRLPRWQALAMTLCRGRETIAKLVPAAVGAVDRYGKDRGNRGFDTVSCSNCPGRAGASYGDVFGES